MRPTGDYGLRAAQRDDKPCRIPRWFATYPDRDRRQECCWI